MNPKVSEPEPVSYKLFRNFTLISSILNLTTQLIFCKTALITGISGQDGYYLAQLLLEKKYDVVGVTRGIGEKNILKDFSSAQLKQVLIKQGTLSDLNFIESLLNTYCPDEIYHLGGQTSVVGSFDLAVETFTANVTSTLNLLEALRKVKNKKNVKLFYASSSEIFGKPSGCPQTELSDFQPTSPYGISKLASHLLVSTYRKQFGIFACNGILYNHESPRRDSSFVFKKITKAAARIKKGLQDSLSVGNLESKRDWGSASDFVEAMWLTLQQETSSDFIIATGKSHSVRELIELSFATVGIEIEWCGSGLKEYGRDKQTQKKIIEVNPQFFRHNDPFSLVGDISKIQQIVGWSPKISFESLIISMVKSDFEN